LIIRLSITSIVILPRVVILLWIFIQHIWVSTVSVNCSVGIISHSLHGNQPSICETFINTKVYKDTACTLYNNLEHYCGNQH
jgi:hypothetical protein